MCRCVILIEKQLYNNTAIVWAAETHTEITFYVTANGIYEMFFCISTWADGLTLPDSNRDRIQNLW